LFYLFQQTVFRPAQAGAKKNAMELASHGISKRLRVMGRSFPAHARSLTRAYGQTFIACHHQFLLEILFTIT
jgi:hypothetical protein